jgi:hypothetical protein
MTVLLTVVNLIALPAMHHWFMCLASDCLAFLRAPSTEHLHSTLHRSASRYVWSIIEWVTVRWTAIGSLA